jgi:signal transduction histidine kinase
LQARNQDLDAFAHTVAHDLKTPLGLIVGFADLLRETDDTIPASERSEYLRAIVQNGRKMSQIINNLLLLAQVRKSSVETMPLDMSAIVAEAQQRLAHKIAERQAKVILPADWPMARGYGPWVEEVWVNYMSNALKCGGQPPYVELGATAQSEHAVRFWVRDNGSGISPEDQSRLFAPFTQLDSAQGDGHGLGLSIVRRIVEKLGGQVGVESQPGQGSVFTFTLPRAV